MPPKTPDVFGKILWGYYHGKKVAEIIERDDGWIDLARSGPAAYLSSYPQWSQLEKNGIKLARGPVLDIGCGAGRHSLYLQKKGLAVTGIDSSPLAIRTTKARGLKDARVLGIENVDRLPKNKYASVIMLGHNFGLFRNARFIKTALRKLARVTTSDAIIIAESMDQFDTQQKEHKEYHQWNIRHGRMAGQNKIRVRLGNEATPWFEYLFVSPKEMEKLLMGTGWKVQKYLRDDGATYIAVLRKT